MTVTSEQLVVSAPPIPRHPRLQRFYLLLGVCVFASVVYFSAVKPHIAPDSLDRLYDRDDDEMTSVPPAFRPPNIVLVLTDDQDSVLLGASRMPQTQQLVAASGAVLSNAFVASPLCCPSRSSIMSGRYVHNHGAFNNSVEGGCSSPGWQEGPETQALAVHLHSAGYQTFFAGKYLNQYGEPGAGGVAHVPPGWDSWFGLQGNSVYYNYTLSVNGVAEPHGDDPTTDYLTKVIWQRAKEFLNGGAPATEKSSNGRKNGDQHDDADDESDEERELTEPFFMMLSTPAAHEPFTPEPSYANNYTDLKAPRTENFNIENDETKHWLLRLGEQPLSDEIIEKVDGVFRDRLRTVLTVDDMIADVIAMLEEKDLLDNTYIVFTSDNGYHLGEFSLPIDKREPYEFDIRVPFMVRGPGIAEGTKIPYATINVDLAPTLLDLAGVTVPDYMDGMSLKSLLLQDSDINDDSADSYEPNDSSSWTKAEGSSRSADAFASRSILIEHSGEGLEWLPYGCESVGLGVYGCKPEFGCKCEDSSNNTYSCVRQLFIETTPSSKEYNLLSNTDQEGSTSGNHHRNYYNIDQEHQRKRGNSLNRDNELGTHVTVVEGQQSDGLLTLGNDIAIGVEGTTIKDVIFCEWEDDVNFIEYYDLQTDANQLHNAASKLTSEALAEYKALLANLKQCQGESCNTQ